MKTDNGNVVRFYEAMKDDKLAIVINGSQEPSVVLMY